MSATLLDTDSILSGNDQWTKLDLEWGDPVDLDTDEDQKLSPVLSTLDLRKTTFDSSFLFKQVRRRNSKRTLPSPANYKDFLQDLKEEEYKEVPLKQFYFISGQILSAFSVEEICENIDEIFKSVEQLCSATSTIRHKKRRIEVKPEVPDVVHCSISTSDLSFDDTEDLEKEKSDSDDIDRFIDEAFQHLNSTIASLPREADQSTRETVSTLVRKFSTMLRSPVRRCSPRKQRRCSDKFRDLAVFWSTKAFEGQ